MPQFYRNTRNKGSNDEVEINATIIRDTDSAFLLDFSGERVEWFPKSQVTDNGNGTFTMPEWLAIEKGAV